MDAFKELMNRAPELQVATLEELKTISIFSKTAAVFGKHLIKMAKQLPELASQSQQWLEDSQRAMETHIFTEEERGRRAKKEPQVQVTLAGPPRTERGHISGPTSEPPKWKRLGFESGKDMERAEFIASHPEEVQEVIIEAKKEKDVPSKGAIKEKVHYKREKERREKAEKKVKPEIIISLEEQAYLLQLERTVSMCPKESEIPKNWHEDAFKQACDMARIIYKRLEVLLNETKNISG